MKMLKSIILGLVLCFSFFNQKSFIHADFDIEIGSSQVSVIEEGENQFISHKIGKNFSDGACLACKYVLPALVVCGIIKYMLINPMVITAKELDTSFKGWDASVKSIAASFTGIKGSFGTAANSLKSLEGSISASAVAIAQEAQAVTQQTAEITSVVKRVTWSVIIGAFLVLINKV